MLKNSRVAAFTVFELLREKQQGAGVTLPPPLSTQINVKTSLPKQMFSKSVLKLCIKFTGEHPFLKSDFNGVFMSS